jgi:hypothetical protein
LVSSEFIPVSDISLNGDTATKNRQGDGSFDNYFESEKRKVLLSTFDQIQNLANILPLKFDFDTEIQKIEDKPAPEMDNKSAYDHPTPENKHSRQETDNAVRVYSDIKVIKQALMNNLPQPNLMMVPIANLQSYNIDPGNTRVSKVDLQGLIDEIVKKVELIKSGRKSEMNFSLFEKNFGELNLSLSLSGGVLSIKIAADAEAKKALEDNITELEIALKEAKIKLDGIKIVEVGNDRSAHYPA